MMALADIFRPRRPPQVREAADADLARLAEIHAAAFARGWDRAEFERLLAQRSVRAHVVSAGAGREPDGFVLSHVVAPEAEILSIAVAADARGHGLGRALLEHHLGRLAGEGVTTSFLEVDEANEAALRLYKGLGYEVISRRRGYYGGSGHDALMLRLDF